MEKKRIAIIAVLLAVSIGNFARLKGTEDIRTIEFLSIFTIGALTGILLFGIIFNIRNKK